MVEEKPKPSKCQFWVEEYICQFWNYETNLCLYKRTSTKDQLPSSYPLCNSIGSDFNCSKFFVNKNDSDLAIKEFHCVLPNSAVSPGNYRTSSKWAYYTKKEDIFLLDTSLISGYSKKGKDCKGEGKNGGFNIKCTGYKPTGLSFGKILSSKAFYSKEKYFDFKVPLNYTGINIRSKLSTCFWWKGQVDDFILDPEFNEEVDKSIQNYQPTTDSGVGFPKIILSSTILDNEVKNVGCIRNDTQEYLEFDFDKIPCNGSNTECPHYTGICWEYLTNEKLQTGFNILAEQILELRYYLKENNWKQLQSFYNKAFKDSYITAWEGELELKNLNLNLNLVDYAIVDTSLDFKEKVFKIKYEPGKIHAGTEVQNSKQNSTQFPTLIKDLFEFLLSPIIITILEEQGEQLIFETGKIKDLSLLVCGNNFSIVQDTVCINLSQLEEIPSVIKELFEYEDVNLLYTATKNISTDSNTCFLKNKFYKIQDDITTIIKELRLTKRNVIIENTLPLESKGFIFDVPMLYGINNLLVLTKTVSSNNQLYWGYTFYSINVVFLNGFLVQKSYKAQSDLSLVVDRLYDYRRSLKGFNAEVELNFIPFKDQTSAIIPDIVDVYNGYKSKDLLLDNVTYVGYETYIYEAEQKLMYNSINPLGSSSYLLVELEDDEKIITSVYGKNNVIIKQNDDTDLYIKYKDNTTCPLLVFKQGQGDSLPDNYVIFKPKNINKFKSICKDSFIYIKSIKVKVKVSFGEPPKEVSKWTLYKEELETGLKILPIIGGNLNVSTNIITIKDFNSTFIATVLLKGISGRIISSVKIKVVVWIKIPMVPDVEIDHKWTAEESFYQNRPVCVCCGPYTRKLLSISTTSYHPDCGDHEVSPMTGKGKMWYPYVQCQSYSRYNKISNQIYGGLMEVKGLYKEKTPSGERINGNWNMRMEGPMLNHFATGFYCCSICACSCQVQTYNYQRTSGADAYFSGFCRYRGAVSESTLIYWINTGGGLPRFGNVLRPQFKSYRSTDYVQYLYWDYTVNPPKYKTRWMWMPSMMNFSDVDYSDPKEVLYDEYMDDTSTLPINALGTMLFTDLDGKNLNEVVDPGRFSFNEVFEVFMSSTIVYPFSVLHMDGKRLPVPQYKDINGDSIQWAWREIQRNIERNFECTDEEDGDVFSLLLFLDLSIPNYKYNKFNQEHRLVCEEGEHILSFVPPELDEDTGEYEDKYPYLQLDDSLKRCFTWNGQLDPEDCTLVQNGDYAELTAAPWESMGLFDEEYVTTIEEAKEAGRILVLSGLTGDLITYYNRGLIIDSIYMQNSANIPVMYELITDVSYTPSLTEQQMSDQIISVRLSFSGRKVAISKGKITFKYGIDDSNELLIIYSIPTIIINNKFYLEGKFPNFYGVREEVINLDFIINVEDLINRKDFFDIDFVCFTSKNEEGDLVPPCVVSNKTKKKSIFIYVTSFIDETPIQVFDTIIKPAKEKIYVYERKYKVSITKNSSLQPPHGLGLDNPVLIGRFDRKELGTVWQHDKNGEVKGLPNSSGKQFYIHKTRTRFVEKAIKDTEGVDATLKKMEHTQSELYNLVLKYNHTSISYTSIIYPGLSTFLEQHNLVLENYTSVGNFYNNTIHNIGTLIYYPKMSAKGHLLLPSLPWHEQCNRMTLTLLGRKEGCEGDDTFIYSQHSMDDGSIETSSFTGLDIFYGGTKLMIQRLKIASFLSTRVYVKYEASDKGKVFEEGDQLASLSIPEFFNIQGLYSDNTWYYPPHRSSSSWPKILPGLWPRLNGGFG